LPVAVAPSPKFHAYCVIVGALAAQAPALSGPPQLVDASKVDGILKFTGVGEIVNCAVGVCAGGKMTPGGARRICTDSGLSVPKFVLVGVATINTHVPGKPLHVPNTPFGGLGGAVYTVEAWPSLPVTIVRADNVPKSPGWPATLISRRSGSA